MEGRLAPTEGCVDFRAVGGEFRKHFRGEEVAFTTTEGVNGIEFACEDSRGWG